MNTMTEQDGQQSQLQQNAEKKDNFNYSVEEIENSPYAIMTDWEGNKKLVIGNNIVAEITDEKKVIKEIQKTNWTYIIPVIGLTVELINKTIDIKNK